MAPNVLIKTQYGSLTVRDPQSFSRFIVYANGTIAFYVTPSPVYTYTAVGYGNGSMLVKFFGPQPKQVTTTAPTVYSFGRQLFTYSASATSILVVVYSGSVEAKDRKS